MPISLRIQKAFGYGGRNHPWRRPWFTALARASARRTGGVVFLEDDALLDQLRAELGLPPGRRAEEYLAELRADEPLREAFDRARRERGFDEDPDWDTRVERLRGIAVVYYGLMREFRPQVVVETGTAAGGYTAFVLAALKHNGAGRLISIDIPPVAGRLTMDKTIDPGSIGYLLPEGYRDVWTYVQGDAKRHLPRILAEEEVDVFIHDSLHTRTHMLFEYAVARALLGEGKLVLSDDIMWNNAFNDFLASNRLTGYSPYSKPGTGVFVNRFDDRERAAGIGLVPHEQGG